MHTVTDQHNPEISFLRQQRDLQFDVCRRLADKIRRNSNVDGWDMARTADEFAAANSSKAMVVATSEELAREQDVLYALDTAIESLCATPGPLSLESPRRG